MNNKKGISPLIATVLIVGFTIVLAVLVITWISGTVSKQTEDTDCQVEVNNKCLEIVNKLSVQHTWPTTSLMMASIVNSGSTGITAPSRIVAIPVKSDGTTDGTLNKNMTVGAYTTSTQEAFTIQTGVYTKLRLIPVIDNGECNAECAAVEFDI